MLFNTKTKLVILAAAGLILVSGGNAFALNFSEFSDTVTSSFSGDPFAPNRLIAGASIFVFIFLIYGGFRLWKRQAEQTVERHYEIVKQRHQAYMEAVKSGKGQKRQWFRLYAPAEFEWLPPHRPVPGNRPKFKQDRLVDVSAGGIGFLTTETLEAGDQLKLILYTGEGSPIFVDAHVVRVIPDKDSGGLMSSIGAAFDNLSEADRDRMIAWIARRQRDLIVGSDMPAGTGKGAAPPSTSEYPE